MHGADLQDGQLRRRLGGFGAARIQGTEYLGHGAPGCLLHWPAGHLLRHQIQECDVSGDVRADHRLPNTAEGDQSALFLGEQRLFHDLALNGVAQRSAHAAGFDLALDQIVLSAFLKRLRREALIVQPREHYQRDARRGRVRPPYRIEALRIRQTQIQQNDVDCVGRDMRLRLANGCHVDQLDAVLFLLIEHFPKQSDVSWIVLDQEQRHRGFFGHPLCGCCGRRTLLNQKSLMLLTMASKSSS